MSKKQDLKAFLKNPVRAFLKAAIDDWRLQKSLIVANSVEDIVAVFNEAGFIIPENEFTRYFERRSWRPQDPQWYKDNLKPMPGQQSISSGEWFHYCRNNGLDEYGLPITDRNRDDDYTT
ncbi:MAG: hypothetical protein GPJ00_17235 [Microcystis aeruginosa W13-18]|jgi:hypothetical protein|nr:hypothetical protein [Microcystis aeruginosa W13-18]NCR01567.1 hypothetical protein [Microcystis aeruginosa L211-11]NCR33183.1 hypothetical protein [Microcystis aeruginosa L211-101]NCR37053.1 hypothetical protein [Microcystis aeruginosa S11-05]NCR50583.1 hypothetical protein [Microcystis aeruginosa S11-01]